MPCDLYSSSCALAVWAVHSDSTIVTQIFVSQMACCDAMSVLQEQGAYLKQQLAAVCEQLQAKDAQLIQLQQQLHQAEQVQQPGPVSTELAVDLADGAGIVSVSPSTLASSRKFPSHRDPSVTGLNPQLQSAAQVLSHDQPQTQALTTSGVELQEIAESVTPRHQFVAQRIKELQSRQSSPEKSLSSASSMGLSPRTGRRGEFDKSTRAGLFGDVTSSSRAGAVDSSPRADQVDRSPEGGQSEATLSGVSARAVGSRSRAGQMENRLKADVNSPGTSSVAKETIETAFDSSSSSSRAVVSCMTAQQSRRVTSVSDVSDGLGAPAASRRDSRSVTPPSGRASPELQRVSPRSGAAGVTPSGLLMPSGPSLTEAHDKESLAWGGGVEVGSPGTELPSDEESEAADWHFDDTGASTSRNGRVPGAAGSGGVLNEDSAQFGPEASAMSLPGVPKLLQPFVHAM